MDKAILSINGHLKIYNGDELVFDDHNDIIHQNFLELIGKCVDGTDTITDMKFGTGTGIIDTTDTVSGLFALAYSEPVLGAGNIYDYSISGSVLTLNFSVTMMLNNGNGSGSVDYTECGLFDGSGKKLTHVTFPVVNKNPTNILRFYYSVDIEYNSVIPYLGEQLVTAFIPARQANDEVVLNGSQTFTRASTAYYFSPTTGLLTSAAVNEQRFISDSDGVIRPLIENTTTNQIPALNWRTAAMWSIGAPGTVVADQIGIDGQANKACTLTDTSITVSAYATTAPIAIPADTATHFRKCFIKKNSATNAVMILGNLTGGTPQYPALVLDSATGAFTAGGELVNAEVKTADNPDWWEVSFGITNNGTNTAMAFEVHPARRASIGSPDDVTLTGSVVVDWPQIELNVFNSTSPIDGGSTRAADLWYITNANIPTLLSGCTIVCTASIPNNSTLRMLFSCNGELELYRDTTGVLKGYLGSISFTTTYTPDENIHEYVLRTDGTNHDVLEDGIVVHSFTGTLVQPTLDMYFGSTTGSSNFLNSTISDIAIYPRYLSDAELNK